MICLRGNYISILHQTISICINSSLLPFPNTVKLAVVDTSIKHRPVITGQYFVMPNIDLSSKLT